MSSLVWYFVVSGQVWWRADARTDYKCRLWFGILLFLRRSDGGQMPGLIKSFICVLVFLVSGQV